MELDIGNSLTCQSYCCSGVISSTQCSAGQFDLGVEISSNSDKSDDGEHIQSQACVIPKYDREDSSLPHGPMPALVLLLLMMENQVRLFQMRGSRLC